MSIFAAALLLPAGAGAQDAPASDAPGSDAAIADTTSGDASTEADAFGGRLRSLRILSARFGTSAVTTQVDGDDSAAVAAVELQLDEPFEGPAPLQNPVALRRTGTGYDSMGTLTILADSSAGVVEGVAYALTFDLIAADGTASTLVYEAPVVAGENVTGPPVIFDGTAYHLSGIGWSTDLNCSGCPVVSLVDGGDPANPAFAPELLTVFAEPLAADVPTGWEASFKSFATTADFGFAGLEFEDDAVGVEYQVTASMQDADGRPLGTPETILVTVELDEDDEDPEPSPTLVVDGTFEGSLAVEEGDYVLLAGTVTRNVRVTGGTLVIQGGTVGKNLRLDGGTVVLDGATINKNLKARAGEIEVGVGHVGRDIVIKGMVTMSGTDSSVLDARTLRGKTTEAVTLGGNLFVDSVSLRAGDLTVTDSISAEGDVDMRVRGNGDGGLIVNGTISASEGEIFLKSDGDGGLVVNDSISAEGDIEMRVTGHRGDLDIDGPLETGGSLKLRHRGLQSFALNIRSDVVAAFEVDARVTGSDSDLIVDGTIDALGDVFLRTDGGDLVVNGEVNGGDVDLRVRPNYGLLKSRLARVRGRVRCQGSAGIVAGDVSIDGSIETFGAVELDATNELTINGTVDAGTDVQLSGANAGLTGLLSAGLSLYSGMSGSTDLGWESIVVTGGDVILNSGSDLSIDGTVESGGTVTLNSQNFSGNGALVADKGLSFGMDVDVIVQDDMNIVVHDGSVSIDAGATLSINGDLTAGDDVVLDSGTTTTVTGNVTAAGLVEAFGGPVFTSHCEDMFDDMYPRISGGGGVNIEATEVLELSCGEVSSPDGAITLNGGATIVRPSANDAVGPTALDAGTDIVITGTESGSVQGDLTYGGGTWTGPTVGVRTVFYAGGRLIFDGDSGEMILELGRE